MTTLYGIRNCDTTSKARRWLQANGIDHRFHDLRVDGLGKAMLDRWLQSLDWASLLNRRGTTWRQLPAAVREHIDHKTAVALMLEQPAIIRRPLLDHDDRLYPGYNAEHYATIFHSKHSS